MSYFALVSVSGQRAHAAHPESWPVAECKPLTMNEVVEGVAWGDRRVCSCY